MIAMTIRSSTRLKPFLHRLRYLVQDPTSQIQHPTLLASADVGSGERNPTSFIPQRISFIQHPAFSIRRCLTN